MIPRDRPGARARRGTSGTPSSRLAPGRAPVVAPVVALVLALVLAVLLGACAQSVAEQNAVVRGDQAFARGDLDEALAEYRLAVLQGNEDAEVHARVAHTYALMSRVDEAADSYRDAAEGDSAYADQAVADLVRLARDAAARNDLFNVASAMSRAAEFRPGLSVDDLALPLARHYSRSGEFDRAIPFYQKALGALPPDSASAVVYETALAYEEVGDCGRALVFFERYRETIPRWQRGEVNWHVGDCSFSYARSLAERGSLDEALRHVQRTIDLGEPKSRQAPAWFEKGQILSLLGDCEGALEAYREVRDVEVGRTGPLVTRAQQRIDRIRFGGDEDRFDPGERCGLPEPGGSRRSG